MDKPKIYWDACIFIAWLKDEKRDAGEMEDLAGVVTQISNKDAFMFTSVMTQTEVLSGTLTTSAKKVFDDVFMRQNIYMVDVTQKVSQLAHDIRNHYRDNGIKLKTPDATHLATAIIHSANEFHTFDEQLLKLHPNVAGYPLKICKPQSRQSSLF